RIMNEAGYNPIEMAHFFEKLQAEGGSRAPQFLSDHPNPGNRVKAVEEEVRALPQHPYGTQVGDFERVKGMVAKLPQVRTQPKGLGVNAAPPSTSSRPSGGFKQLRGREFALSYPANWEVFGDNNSPTVTIAPREGVVQGSSGGNSIGYGAIVSYFFPESQTKDLQQVTEELIHHLHAANSNMR